MKLPVYKMVVKVMVLLICAIPCSESFARNAFESNSRQSQILRQSDAWITNTASRPDLKSCHPIDRALIAPVAPARRAEAVALLHQVPIIRLTGATAAKWAESTRSTSGANLSASGVISNEIKRLEFKKNRQLNEKVGGWSGTEQARLDELYELQRDPDLLRFTPFLVRAIANNQSTGGFELNVCGKYLWISQISLGTGATTSIHAPLIVFLPKTPKYIYVTLGMAQ